MSIPALALAVLLAWHYPIPGKLVELFPDHFTSQSGEQLCHHALKLWPGPTVLVQEWRSGELSEEQQVALLLGGAGFHDRQLLPVYQEAIKSPLPRVRLAAASGYRTLLGDQPPLIGYIDRISDKDADAFLQEMRDVERTLRRNPLVLMWLVSALGNEETILPGWTGVVMRRPAITCFQAVERVVQPEDLELLLATYPFFHDPGNRLHLLRLIEGMTLARYVVMPQPGKGWGPEVYRKGLRDLATWLETRCGIGFEEVLAERFAEMGAAGVDPLSVAGCHHWHQLLRQGDPGWWLLAARQLYWCGGPPATLSILRADQEVNKEKRDYLLKWYEPGQSRHRARRPRRPEPRERRR